MEENLEPLGILSIWSLPKAMAPHSSTLAWRIPWMEEPGGLQSMGSLRVGHDWVTSLSLFTFMHWRREWQPTPIFLPGESQGQGSLVGCRLWGRTESDTTESNEQQQQQPLNPIMHFPPVLIMFLSRSPSYLCLGETGFVSNSGPLSHWPLLMEWSDSSSYFSWPLIFI